MDNQKKKSPDFIISLLVIIFLVITFLWYSRPLVNSSPENSYLNTTMIRIKTLEVLLMTYNSDKGFFPPENNGLALVVKEYDEDNSLLLDGWGNKILYKATDEHIYVISLGADGEKGGTDLDEDIGVYDLWD